ncbi:H-type lectin domain-containing protein [Caballeronia sp. LjRoot34]|uniref:H-type lectin domain-containing protein n=1 Tax=Caballeronia sp. LjRoot34 TaxID=3342325 RepID=UPI003ECDDD09
MDDKIAGEAPTEQSNSGNKGAGTDSGAQLKLGVISSVTSVVIAVISAIAAWHATTKSSSVEAQVSSINFIAGTVSTGGNAQFGPLPAGFEGNMPQNWRAWRRQISFWKDESGIARPGVRPFSRPPQVFVTLKSIDGGGPGTGNVRISVAAPPAEVTRDGFALYMYTWVDESGKTHAPAWVEVSWFAYDGPSSTQ